MWALDVVVLRVLGDQVVEVLLAEHDEVVQCFLMQTLNESFDMRLQVRRTDAVLSHLDAGVAKHVVESGPVDAVAVAEQQRDLLTVRFYVLHELLRLLLHPCGIRRSRAFRHVNPAAAEVQINQHEILLQAELRHDPFKEEVALVQCLRMPLTGVAHSITRPLPPTVDRLLTLQQQCCDLRIPDPHRPHPSGLTRRVGLRQRIPIRVLGPIRPAPQFCPATATTWPA